MSGKQGNYNFHVGNGCFFNVSDMTRSLKPSSVDVIAHQTLDFPSNHVGSNRFFEVSDIISAKTPNSRHDCISVRQNPTAEQDLARIRLPNLIVNHRLTLRKNLFLQVKIY